MSYKLDYFIDRYGNKPCERWLGKLRDKRAKDQITKRLERIEEDGDFGDHEYADKGVWYLRIHIGPGYRVYFAREGNQVILLLCGGNKTGQQKDIALAKDYLDHHRRHK